MKRKDWIIKYSLEFVIIVLGITASFWLNEVSINNQNNKERIKILLEKTLRKNTIRAQITY